MDSTPAAEVRIDFMLDELRALYMLAVLGAATMSLNVSAANTMMDSILREEIDPKSAMATLRKMKLMLELDVDHMVEGIQLCREAES